MTQQPTPTTTPTLLHELDALHESYVSAVNSAVTDDDLNGAGEIAAAYEAEVLDLVATAQRTRGAA